MGSERRRSPSATASALTPAARAGPHARHALSMLGGALIIGLSIVAACTDRDPPEGAPPAASPPPPATSPRPSRPPLPADATDIERYQWFNAETLVLLIEAAKREMEIGPYHARVMAAAATAATDMGAAADQMERVFVDLRTAIAED